MKEPILVILAAGMGSRYGGLKQLDAMGPSGEVILDYSLFDAHRAGFKRVVFLIKHEIEEDFKRLVGQKAEKQLEVSYAFQHLDAIPAPFRVPEGRKKPWGTGHALLCCKEFLDAPFLVINADDYYGVEAFRTAYQTLCALQDGDKAHYFMIGYRLCNTVTENGHVARGVCSVDEKGRLTGVTERTHIVTSSDGPLYTEDGETYHLLPGDALVSMNMWGFTPGFLTALESGFAPFLVEALAQNPLKAEYFLPTVVNGMLERQEAEVLVLPSQDKWYGVTYQADKPVVQAALARMAKEGLYPTPLWA